LIHLIQSIVCPAIAIAGAAAPGRHCLQPPLPRDSHSSPIATFQTWQQYGGAPGSRSRWHPVAINLMTDVYAALLRAKNIQSLKRKAIWMAPFFDSAEPLAP
jgi:hypothetical protein